MSSELITHLNETNFQTTIDKESAPILVDFWAEWCGPCRALSPVIDELSQEFQGKIKFAKVNVDEAGAIASQFGIRGIPTLLLFQGGKKVNELVGNQTKDKLRAMLTKVTT